MKTSLIKKTARTFFLVQAVMLVTSCSNFLNIDNYFDDEFNIDSVFTNARYMEAYMWEIGSDNCWFHNYKVFIVTILIR